MIVLALGLAGAVAAVGVSTGAVSAGEDGKSYVVGIVPQRTVRETLRVWAPILRELERRTGARFVFGGARGHREFEIDLAGGKYDFVYLNPYAALMAAQRQGYVPLVCSGSRRLQGVLVTHVDSGVNELGQLRKGARIAFSSPNALAGSLLMRADLTLRRHMQFEPVYVKTHSSVLLHVAQGLVDAGNSADTMLAQAPPELRAKLKVIHRTSEVTPHPLMAHPGVPRRIRDAVRDAMVDLGASESGRALLAGIPMPDPRRVDIADYRPLEAMSLEKFLDEAP